MARFAVFGREPLIMLLGDHFVWPALVGGAARLPFLLALVGVFGGLATFGLVGLFAGPAVWREWIIEAR